MDLDIVTIPIHPCRVRLRIGQRRVRQLIFSNDGSEYFQQRIERIARYLLARWERPGGRVAGGLRFGMTENLLERQPWVEIQWNGSEIPEGASVEKLREALNYVLPKNGQTEIRWLRSLPTLQGVG